MDPKLVEELAVDALDFFRQCLERLAFDPTYNTSGDSGAQRQSILLFPRAESDHQLTLLQAMQCVPLVIMSPSHRVP